MSMDIKGKENYKKTLRWTFGKNKQNIPKGKVFIILKN